MNLATHYLLPPLSSFGRDQSGTTVVGIVRGTVFRITQMLAFGTLFILLAGIAVVGNHHTSIGFLLGFVCAGSLAAALTRMQRPLPVKIMLSGVPERSVEPVDDGARPLYDRAAEVAAEVISLKRSNPDKLKAEIAREIKELEAAGVNFDRGDLLEGSTIMFSKRWTKLKGGEARVAALRLMRLVGGLAANGQRRITIALLGIGKVARKCTEMMRAIKAVFDEVSKACGTLPAKLILEVPMQFVNNFSKVGFSLIPETGLAG